MIIVADRSQYGYVSIEVRFMKKIDEGAARSSSWLTAANMVMLV